METSINANDYNQQDFSDTEIKNICGRFRAKKSRLLKSEMSESQAIRSAAKVIPSNFPKDRLPKDLRHLTAKSDSKIDDREVKEFVAEAIKRGDMTLVGSKQGEAEPKQDPLAEALAKLADTEAKLNVTEKARSETEAHLNATQLQLDDALAKRLETEVKHPETKAKPAEDFELKRLFYPVATLTLYALIVPSTASIFNAVLERIESPFPILAISYALALIIDWLAISFVSRGFKNPKSRQGYQALAVAASLILLNAAGLYYKLSHKVDAVKNQVIEAQEIRTEKARLHWLESKWRKEANPVACEASPAGCGIPFTQASRSRQNEYELEKNKLSQLKTDSAIDTNSMVHAGYFLLFWILLGLVSHLKATEGVKA